MTDTPKEPGFRFKTSTGFAGLLHSLGAHLTVSTYQAGRVIFMGSPDGHSLTQVPVPFRRPMGISFHEEHLVVASMDEVQVFRSTQEHVHRFSENPELYDRLYFPRATYYTGALDLHDIHIGKGSIWAVNTRFSCLCTFSLENSFTPRWKPPWICDLTPDDRCHLNGMVLINDRPAYATALGTGDEAGSWREDIVNGGVLLEVPSGDVVASGLAMPHSPRLIGDHIYLLLSASGQLARVHRTTGALEILAELGGFCRGMDVVGNHLFIGMSKLRKSSRTFSKLPVADMEDRCGIIVFDMLANKTVGELWYQDTVEEIYDLRVYPSRRPPALVGAWDDRHKDLIMTRIRDFFREHDDEV